MGTLSGGETLTVESYSIPAVIDPDGETLDLVLGGDGDHRTLSLLVQTSDLTRHSLEIEKGAEVSARGQDWIVESIQAHPITTRLSLQSPNRRS
jgi:hypothetical protein